MKLSLSLLAPLFLSLSIPVSASPHPYPRLLLAKPSNVVSPPTRSLQPRHDNPGCDVPHTYTTTYTSDIVRTYTVFSVSTATETYTSLRTSTKPWRGRGTRTMIRTQTLTEVKTQTVTDHAPAATATVTITKTDTETDALTKTVSVSAAAPSASSSGGECNTGPLQCCDTVVPASSPGMSSILAVLGVGLDVLNGLGDALVGTSCSPISALSLGGGVECNQTPVCCNNNTYQGLINIGCVPIKL
ncbi:hypothetical protein GSI_05336 [Ganoderma sinense ZZ0214-1]|uniref:Hydrophobin n=1 Tax=Ganoderma sinense ZZ0214-1 TaxID=1077348 RepID=A0A2G8SFU4_9APHY|nr:hypothetical protein GSI_05336 [Ganoderma sinense ZZ0214-1]